MLNANEFSKVLGADFAAPAVAQLVAQYGMKDVKTFEDLPFERYVGAKSRGICLLLEDERVVDVQIHVEPTGTYAAFDAPPYGLRKGMTQAEVHELLGQPDSHDNVDSRYALDGGGVLVVAFSSGAVRYLSIGLPV